jgi:hypothetical protein
MWITFLALKHIKTGVVDKNPTGIARLCNLPLEKVMKAISKFESPDPNSSSTEHEGRRLLKLETGGWLVINHERYMSLGWSDDKKAYERDRKAAYRERGNIKPGAGQPDDGRETGNGSWSPTPLQLRLGKLFKRKETTRWDAREEKAVKSLGSPLEDDLRLLEAYYGANIPKDQDYRRHDLITLLNNFNGEVDRARKFKPPQPRENQI